MDRNTRRIRKEKKIFDPSDFDQPAPKKLPAAHIKGNISKLKPCTVKVESLDSVIERKSLLTSAPFIKSPSAMTCNSKIKDELINDMDIDDLLKDDEQLEKPHIRNKHYKICQSEATRIILKKEKPPASGSTSTQVKQEEEPIKNDDDLERKSPHQNHMVIECPNCHMEFQDLNRLKLHIDAKHEFKDCYIECIVCQERMMGPQYEGHVLSNHFHMLTSEQYVLTPRPVMEPSRYTPTTQPHAETEDEPEVIFNADNPWLDILSESVRQKRAIDAKIVRRIKASLPRLSHKFSQCQFKLGGMHVPRRMKLTADFYRLQQKSEFVSCLSSEPHFKTYLESYREHKIRRRLLDKYRDKLTTSQISSLGALDNVHSNHKKMHQLKYVPKETPSNMVKVSDESPKPPTPSNAFKAPFHRVKIPSRMQTGIVEVYPNELKKVMDNLKKKGINSFDMNQSKNSKVIIRSKSLLNQNMNQSNRFIEHLQSKGKIDQSNPPKKIIVASPQLKKNIIAMLQSNSTIMVPHKNIKEEKDPLAIEVEAEQDSVSCQSVSDNNVIALNIPIEDIIGSSSEKSDMNKQNETLIAACSIKKEC